MSAHEQSLQTLCRQLNSDKIKERQDAVSQIREVFARDSAVSAVSAEGWTALFSKLHGAFAKELASSTKKGTLTTETTGPGANALKRLGEIASTIRWLTEKSIDIMTPKTIMPLLMHLLRYMKYRSRLLEPVAVHYIKAIKIIVDCDVFLRYLELKDIDTWMKVIEMGFNVILGDSLNTKLENVEDDGEGEDSTLLDLLDEDTGAGSVNDDQTEDIPQSSNPRKRRRSEQQNTPLPTQRGAGARRPVGTRSVTPEQVASAAVLAVVLKSETAPLLSPDFMYLPSAILTRLSRFLSRYPGETTLHHDYFQCLSGVLSQVALNNKKEVSFFARRSWNDLVNMWGTRTQTLKEGLVVVLRTLLPYLAAGIDSDRPTRVTYEDGLNRLWKVLIGEADKRGVEGLSLDCIRLQLVLEDDEHDAFVAKTFRHGWNFDSGQALSWAILSLQTICAEKIYILSESLHSSTSDGGKRFKRENPITTFFSSSGSSTARAYRLQGLLFFIDQYWIILHDDLRKAVISSLQHLLSLDDALIQSWTFLCLAAIGNAESTSSTVSFTPSQQLVTQDTTSWNSIWTHAMRRTAVPAVCRAACHAAYVLLLHSKFLLSHQQVLVEIETLAKDLDIQGPSFPYDSSCSFLVLCMRVASHDVRLYRMQLEEKVLGWLTDTWTPGATVKSRMAPYTLSDILAILGVICCLPKIAQVLCPMKLPDCSITTAMIEEHHTAVIRDYLLHAQLPQGHTIPIRSDGTLFRATPSTPIVDDAVETRELLQPRGRERRVSAFLLKALEDALQQWEASSGGRPTAEKTRASMDVAVISLLFEATLITNGTRSNRRVQQAAYKLICLVVPHAIDSRWTLSERALILAALEPLVLVEESRSGLERWNTLLPVSPSSGIRKELSQSSGYESVQVSDEIVGARRRLQKAVFQSPDVRDMVIKVCDVLHTTLRHMLPSTMEHGSGQHMDVDDKDPFGASELARATTSASAAQQLSRTAVRRELMDACVTSLAVLPGLQSSTGEPIRDKRLLDVVQAFEWEDWLIYGPSFIDNVKRKNLHLSANNAHTILERFGDELYADRSAQGSAGQLLALTLLQATMHIWLHDDTLETLVEVLCSWLCRVSSRSGMGYWACRDQFVQFLESYIAADPAQTMWSAFKESEGKDDWVPIQKPSDLLPQFGDDSDIRVRFRAAVANARLVCNARYMDYAPMHIYTEIRTHLNVDLDQYEHIITRLLCLSNIMVVSSAVRRGPLWHLLEICLHSHVYTRHVETLLCGVAQRLGLSSSTLFMAYASQIAYSLRQTDRDFLQLPAHLLGYRDKRECAEATFAAFTPTNVLPGRSEERGRGRSLFKTHCQVTKKTPAEGIKQCFSEIVGRQIVSFLDQYNSEEDVNTLSEHIQEITKDVEEEYPKLLSQHADGIVVAVLRTLRDQDYLEDGPIVTALRKSAHPSAAVTFRALTQYRRLHEFEVHEPNLPAFSTATILRSLDWLQHHVPLVNQHSTTYHVLHQLFADIGHSPLVNEQIRLLTAISIWASLHHDDLRNTTILRTFINGAANILPQPDLARSAQSLLEWGFSLYLQFESEETRLASVLMRVSCTAYDYSVCSSADLSVMGRDLLQWAEAQAVVLWKRKSLRRQVNQALSAWPCELSLSVQSMVPNTSSEDISAILRDSRISSNKFRLVQRLHDLDVTERTSGSDFWMLKACIPPRASLSNTDMEAFCDYLVSHLGFSNNLDFAPISIYTVRTRHARGLMREGSTTKPPSNDGSTAQQAIIVSLLSILEEPSIPQVQLSYSTLRALAALLSSDAEHLPAEYREELTFLKDYRRSIKPRPQPDLTEFFQNHAWVDLASDFSSWIAFVSPVFSDVLAAHEPFYAPLTSILQAHTIFAEQVFPVLVHTLLQRERSDSVAAQETPMRKYLSGYFDRLLKADTTSIPCRRVLVDTVLHLRYFVPTSSKDPMRHDALSCDKWLDVDFILLSKNAILYGAYTTALLCLELAAEHNGLKEGTPETEQIMYDIYGHIDEPDGFYGIQTHDLQKFLLQRFHHEKQWDKAFQFHGAKLERHTSGSEDVEGVVEALHAFGFDHLAMSTLHGTSSDASSESHGVAYQLGWRTEKWDLPERPEHPISGAPLYVALRAVYRERDIQIVNKTLRRSLIQEIENLSSLGIESVTDIKQVVQDLMCLHQVAKWQSISAQLDRSKADISTMAFVDDDFEFHDLEAIMAVRISLLRSALQQEQREQIGDMLSPLHRELSDIQTSCLLRLSQAARRANQKQIAMNSIVRAQQLSPQTSFEVSEEFAEVLWLTNEPKLAVQYLANLLGIRGGLEPSGSADDSVRNASALAKLGRWTSEASLEKAADIQSKYFDPAARFASSHASHEPTESQTYAVIYHQFAMFADRQYHAIVKSPDALRWKFYAERKRQEVLRRQEELIKAEHGSAEWKRIASLMKKAGHMLREDQRQFQEHINSRDGLLSKAIEMYSRSLEVSDKFDDDSAIRLCSLWFSNFDYDDDNFQTVVGAAVRRIPSRKFVFLAHQLTARISDKSCLSDGADQNNLQELVLRMCREHPFHSLYQVWCLQSERKSASSSSSRRQSSRLESSSSQAARANAAGGIFDKLKNIDESTSRRIRDVELVCRASLEWAVYPIKDTLKGKRSSGPHDVPRGLSILKLQDIQIPVITADTPIDPTTRYDRCIWIKAYERIYITAGGLNLPKISKCIGSDGVPYKQLFKGEGNDDLRQDAVMEQVFQLVNVILRRDRETVRRSLSVRDYKVIPLASQAGVLEFVTNTSPLKHFLESGHRRYRPKDLTGHDIAKALDDTRKANLENPGLPAMLLEMYLDLTKRFKPVMRHYFTEKHKTPSAWFKMRLKYSRSVATNSIVGHILGLGDRHTSNILMDNSTGEVVHIDLGIAFDQGKMLPAPERVPFRLTRDMIDGLGTSGTQGVFQRCAEETLRVLRAESGVIVTVLEVFKHDPLHSWTASEFKVKRVQATGDTDLLTEEAVRYALGMDMSSGSLADEHADRALNAVSRKLDKSMTVEYTVNELIAEATDVKNLASMYSFWYPHY